MANDPLNFVGLRKRYYNYNRCLVSDCGKCKHSLNVPKYGGKCVMK